MMSRPAERFVVLSMFTRLRSSLPSTCERRRPAAEPLLPDRPISTSSRRDRFEDVARLVEDPVVAPQVARVVIGQCLVGDTGTSLPLATR